MSMWRCLIEGPRSCWPAPKHSWRLCRTGQPLCTFVWWTNKEELKPLLTRNIIYLMGLFRCWHSLSALSVYSYFLSCLNPPSKPMANQVLIISKYLRLSLYFQYLKHLSRWSPMDFQWDFKDLLPRIGCNNFLTKVNNCLQY